MQVENDNLILKLEKELIDISDFEVGKGRVEKNNILPTYMDMLRSKISLNKTKNINGNIKVKNAAGGFLQNAVFSYLI